MRKSVIVSSVLPLLASAAALLWLLWYFFPIPIWIKGIVTLVMVIALCRLGGLDYYRRRPLSDTDQALDFLSLDQLGPVVLVCGDGMDDLFPDKPLRKTAQGCWLRVGDLDALTAVIRNIQAHYPRQIGQLSIMYSCLPDRHQDEAVLRASVKVLRQQVRQVKSLTGFQIPVVLNGQFSGPETPWNIVQGDNPVVCPVDEALIPLREWQQKANNITVIPVLSQAFAFTREILLDELEKTDPLCPPVYALAVVLRSGAPSEDVGSLWSHWLLHRAQLEFPEISGLTEYAHRFADPLLSLLSPFAIPLQGGQTTRRVIFLLLLCALCALSFSIANNRNLIRQVGTDLQRWHAIPMSHYEPKAQALSVLKRDTLLLERWQRQGEPLKLALGLYSGQHLWLALQQAIDTYIGPAPSVVETPPEPTQAPTTIRLDSLSLFDVGKFQLKPDSTKMLVNALIGIKAKPGWLIVVAGHTDITGNAQANQTLSLKRAEALRDWMLSTSDVSPTCFAVQGYGATQPIASNDTPEGRALNRRVEISLVPQANACLANASQ
ncbi:OmpA family protein [Rouxiella sp. Mn2063]|uniref:OmpA family protein n=1 Tax=Rouxiella sp. Mn2063 TaxID=3395262 RepID=UPI003BD9FC93